MENSDNKMDEAHSHDHQADLKAESVELVNEQPEASLAEFEVTEIEQKQNLSEPEKGQKKHAPGTKTPANKSRKEPVLLSEPENLPVDKTENISDVAEAKKVRKPTKEKVRKGAAKIKNAESSEDATSEEEQAIQSGSGKETETKEKGKKAEKVNVRKAEAKVEKLKKRVKKAKKKEVKKSKLKELKDKLLKALKKLKRKNRKLKKAKK